jgi:hypothetical protein
MVGASFDIAPTLWGKKHTPCRLAATEIGRPADKRGSAPRFSVDHLAGAGGGAPMSTSPLSQRDLEEIIGRLHKIQPRRKPHAFLLLREWGAIYARGDDRLVSKAELRKLQDRFRQLDGAATALRRLMTDDALGSQASFMSVRNIASSIAYNLGDDERVPLGPQERAALRKLNGFGPNSGLMRLTIIRAAVDALADAVSAASVKTASHTVLSRKAYPAECLECLAEIFHYVSGDTPSRRNTPAGSSGPFFEFAQAAWVRLRGSNDGFEGAMKAWATRFGKEKKRPDPGGFVLWYARRRPLWKISMWIGIGK